jgi:hypothetical protein
VHQILAVLSAYSICRHVVLTLVFNPPVPQAYAYVFVITFLSTSIIQAGSLIYKNRAMGSGFSKAYITHAYGIVNIRLRLSRPLKVKAGEYICLWIPSVSFWSFSQSHPFTVTSWPEGKQTYLDLFIEPRRGLTRDLLTYSKLHHGGSDCLALVSGLHGISVPIDDYEIGLLIASGLA